MKFVTKYLICYIVKVKNHEEVCLTRIFCYLLEALCSIVRASEVRPLQFRTGVTGSSRSLIYLVNGDEQFGFMELKS